MLSSLFKEHLSASVDPGDVVRHAVAITLQKQLECEIERLRGEKAADVVLSETTLEEAAIRATRGKCHQASAYTLLTIADNPAYRPLFDRFILLNAWEQDTPRDHEVLDHSYFLVRDVGGKWYAGSPANYTPESKEHVVEIISGSLKDVVPRLRTYPLTTHCRFPTALEVEPFSFFAKDVIPQLYARRSAHRGIISVFTIDTINTRTVGQTTEWQIGLISYSFDSYNVELV